MVTIAHISDQHFEEGPRWDEHQRITQWIVDHLKGAPPDLITLGGDLFDRRPTPAETRAAAAWVMALADIAPVVAVYGNHDVPGSLGVFPWLNTRHPVHVADRPGTIVVAGMAVHCLPWPRRGEMMAAAPAPDGTREQSMADAAEALRTILRGFRHEADMLGMPGILLGHVQVRGASLSSGQPLAPGADFELGIDDLAMAGARAVLLGHIHMAQEWTTADGAPVIYPGAPRRTAWGETEPKGLAWVELDGADVRVRQIITPATPMVLLSGGHDGDDIVFPEPIPDVGGADVRVRYTVAPDARERGRAAARTLRDSLISGGASVVRMEEIVQADVRVRAPEVVQARTVADKLRSLWTGRGVPEDVVARRLRRLAALEVGDAV
jgi:DNA repair exonuclease SbcCD nuclease subunit